MIKVVNKNQRQMKVTKIRINKKPFRHSITQITTGGQYGTVCTMS